MRPSRIALRRAKGGQRAWTPNAGGPSSSSVPNYLSGNETRQLVYRTLPPKDTVEYEEDFGNNLMIQREYFNPKFRERSTFDEMPLAHSQVELQSGKQRLARMLNSERRGESIASHDTNRVHLETSVDANAPLGEIDSHRYLFDTNRMAYCNRFRGHFPELFSLMEACAILHGCVTHDARETYFKSFLGIDNESLEQLAEEQRNLGKTIQPRSNNEAENSQRSETVSRSSNANSEIDGAFDVVLASLGLAKAKAKPSLPQPSPPEVAIDAQFAEFAPLLRSYEAFCRGEVPTPSQDLRFVGSAGAAAERFRWRRLVDRLVAEEYDTISDLDMMDAAKLNEQLRTIKFVNVRLGETVREVLKLQERDSNPGSAHSDKPFDKSVDAPGKRLAGDERVN